MTVLCIQSYTAVKAEDVPLLLLLVMLSKIVQRHPKIARIWAVAASIIDWVFPSWQV